MLMVQSGIATLNGSEVVTTSVRVYETVVSAMVVRESRISKPPITLGTPSHKVVVADPNEVDATTPDIVVTETVVGSNMVKVTRAASDEFDHARRRLLQLLAYS